MGGTARRRARHPAATLGALALLHVAACLVFSRGFLLTRVELPDVSSCPGPGCVQAPRSPPGSEPASGGDGAAPGGDVAAAGAAPRAAYDRAVIIIVDALRFDFVCENATAAKPHAGQFPRTMALVERAVSGSARGATRRAGWPEPARHVRMRMPMRACRWAAGLDARVAWVRSAPVQL